MSKEQNLEDKDKVLHIGGVISSTIVMACGSRHSCEHCTNYYMRSCSYINRMDDEEYEEHEKLVKASL